MVCRSPRPDPPVIELEKCCGRLNPQGRRGIFVKAAATSPVDYLPGRDSCAKTGATLPSNLRWFLVSAKLGRGHIRLHAREGETALARPMTRPAAVGECVRSKPDAPADWNPCSARLNPVLGRPRARRERSPALSRTGRAVPPTEGPQRKGVPQGAPFCVAASATQIGGYRTRTTPFTLAAARMTALSNITPDRKAPQVARRDVEVRTFQESGRSGIRPSRV